MKGQRRTVQMKEQTRNTQDQLNKEEIGTLLKKEFKIIIEKMFQNFENRMEKMQEAINTVNTITKNIEK